MRERELEEKMLSFLRGDADVLVSTTIIESGLDIPQANTLVVERADALGLAQLYQIRGRVGRSDLLAHAYLFYPDMSELTPEARARLATLADHTELGAGFAIAMRDLEIRGAGELLGAEQHGHLAALGFELYVKLLGEAVAELAGERRTVARPVRVDARIDAYVPAEYIPAEAQKIDLHRRLALTESEDELRELEAATVDRYGPLPEPVQNLFAIQAAKLKLAQLGADYLVFRGGQSTVGPLVLGSEELRALRDRVDTAIYTGYTVVPFYDSLIAKLMVWAPTREQALRRGGRALGEFRLEGIETTVSLHARLLEDERVLAGDVHKPALARPQGLSTSSSGWCQYIQGASIEAAAPVHVCADG